MNAVLRKLVSVLIRSLSNASEVGVRSTLRSHGIGNGDAREADLRVVFPTVPTSAS